MVYITPQVRVFQQYTTTPVVDDVTRRACIIAPNIQTHRFNVAAEKALTGIGLYDSNSGNTAAFPGLSVGGLPALDTVKVFAENALLQYFSDVIGSGDTFVPNSTYANRVASAATNFAGFTGFPLTSTLGDRGVKSGDLAHITGTTVSGSFDVWSVVDSVLRDTVSSSVSSSGQSASNQASVAASSSVSQTAGDTNCVVATVNAAAYNGLSTVDITETYTITVINGGPVGTAKLRVTSASGRDSVSSLISPAAMASPTTIGTRGLTVTFDNTTNVGCLASAATAGVSATDFVVGQTWTVNVTQAFDSAMINVVNPTGYTGSVNDSYIVTVTKGGLFASLPEVTVTTANGSDRGLAPVVVTGPSVAFNVGTYGLQASLSKLVLAGSEIVGLRKGDSFVISMVAPSPGAAKTLVLRDNLPTGLLSATDLNLELYIQDTVEIASVRPDLPSANNWTATASAVTMEAGVTVMHPSWTVSGVPTALPLYSGFVGPYSRSYSNLFVQYNELLSTLATSLNVLFSVADLSAIPGPLDPVNPLKYGVFKAMSNANGQGVGCVAVADPAQISSWQAAMDVLSGRPEVYTFVPLTNDPAVQSLVLTQAVAESGPEATNWKRMICSAPYASVSKLVDVDSNNVVITATITNNTLSGPTGNTLLTVSSGISQFLVKGVRPGDVVRTSFSLDALNRPIYDTYVVNSVISDVQLVLTGGPSLPIAIAQKIEVWRTLTRQEVAQDLVTKAGALGNSRAMFVAPDQLIADGRLVSGQFLCAALAGLMSSVLPHQGLTHFPISGFSGVKARINDYFTKTQLDTMADGGVWIVSEEADGTILSRHAVTTDNSSLIKREEVMGRNLDSMSYEYRNLFKNFIGITNATPTVLTRMQYLIEKKLSTDSSEILDNNLGPRIVSGAIATDSLGNKLVRIHPLAADRIEVVLNVGLPGPNNVTDLYLIV